MGFLMNRRGFWLFLLLVFILPVGILVASLSKDPVEQKFAKIQKGMTREQVTEIMGSEPTDSHSSPKLHPFSEVSDVKSEEKCNWRLRKSVVSVYLVNDKVIGAGFLLRSPTIIDKVRLWIMSWLV